MSNNKNNTTMSGENKTKLVFWEIGKRPQDSVPTEKIIHYIVKDYRRMYNTYQALLDKLHESETKLKGMQEKYVKQNSNYQATIEKYKAALHDAKTSRTAVVESVTDDLREEVKELKRRNGLLLQALSSPKSTIPADITIATGDEQMKRAMKILEKVNEKLSGAIKRLELYESYINRADVQAVLPVDAATVVKKMKKSMTKITSATDQIDAFFGKISGNMVLNETEDIKD